VVDFAPPIRESYSGILFGNPIRESYSGILFGTANRPLPPNSHGIRDSTTQTGGWEEKQIHVCARAVARRVLERVRSTSLSHAFCPEALGERDCVCICICIRCITVNATVISRPAFPLGPADG
jgi:hypothetical protein